MGRRSNSSRKTIQDHRLHLLVVLFRSFLRLPRLVVYPLRVLPQGRWVGVLRRLLRLGHRRFTCVVHQHPLQLCHLCGAVGSTHQRDRLHGHVERLVERLAPVATVRVGVVLQDQLLRQQQPLPRLEQHLVGRGQPVPTTRYLPVTVRRQLVTTQRLELPHQPDGPLRPRHAIAPWRCIPSGPVVTTVSLLSNFSDNHYCNVPRATRPPRHPRE